MPQFNTILLVDDDHINNFVTEKQLRKSEIAGKIKTARNGEEALTYLAESINSCPELILLDKSMPEMDGFGFLKYFKKMTLDKNVRIILLTGDLNNKDREVLESLGYPDVIEKPFTVEKLMDILGKQEIKK